MTQGYAKPNHDLDLTTAMAVYYEEYYRTKLGLPDWKKRVAARLREEEFFGEPMVKKIESWLDYRFGGKQVLVVGAGTGAEAESLSRRGAFVAAMEPDLTALAILSQKIASGSATKKLTVAAVAEAIPFRDGAFDLVYCYSVLEHVQGLERALAEMIRVCKVRGYIFIHTPDYRFPYEGHYKTLFIPYAPRWVQKLWLKLKGRPVAFLETLQFVSPRRLDRLIWCHNVDEFRIYEPALRDTQQAPLYYWFSRLFVIQKSQVILLRKREG